MTNPWTSAQYRRFRGVLGIYLIVHFAMRLPYGAEVFGAGGTVSAATLSPYIGVLPNPLAWFDSGHAVKLLLIVGILAGVLLTAGYFDRAAAIVAALLLGWLFQRNPLIANPSLPLLGWLLVLHVFVPSRRASSLAAGRGGRAEPPQRLPRHLYIAAWIVLSLAYSHSGYTKLLSPSWVEGETIRLVLDNPLARDHALREWVLATPPIVLKVLTWGVLWAEVLFAPLALVRRLRPILWTVMLFAQLGFLCFLNFADLTFPMLLVHWFTFDPRWLHRWLPRSRALLLYDGDCAFCHATVRLAISQDHARRLSFAPLAGPLGKALHRCEPASSDTIVLIHEGRHDLKSRAVAGVLEHIGGVWFLVGKLLRLVPRPLADAAYDAVGRVRYKLGGRDTNLCALLPADRVAHEWRANARV